MNRLNPLAWSGTTWFMIIVFVVLAVGGALSAVFWTDLAGTGDDKDSLSTAVRNVMFMIGALLALPLAIWRGWVAEQQVKATQESVDAAHIAIANQRFQAAAQMLGHELSAVRLGAIHTLTSLSQEDHERYYVQTARLLASFIRQPRAGEQTNTTLVGRGDGRDVREDVSAAIEFVGSRKQEDLEFEASKDFRIDLHSMNLERWDLQGLNFARVSLHGSYFGRGNLTDTNFAGADLTGCYFGGAIVGGAIMWRTRLSSANFSAWSIGENGEYVRWHDQARAPGKAVGLAQSQLDEALDDQDNPPKLRAVRDAESDELLTWHGMPPEPL